MMNKLLEIIILMLLGISLIHAQPSVIWVMSTLEPPIPFLYSGGDEFEGQSLDMKKWATHDGLHNRKCNGELQYYTDNNLEVANGRLKLISKRELIYGKPISYEPETFLIDCGNGEFVPNSYQSWNYTSGTVRYKHPFKYDLVDVRLRLPSEGQGLWPAFWQYGFGEIDFIEAKGEKPTQIHINVHWPNNSGMWGGGWRDLQANLTKTFYNYTFFWLPWEVRWYFEGIFIDKHASPGFLQLIKPQSLFINLAIAGYNGAFPPGPNSSTKFPAIFEIEYVRFYTALWNQNSVIEFCNYQQQPTDMTVHTGKTITLGGDEDCNVTMKKNEYATFIATDKIFLKKGFQAETGSNVKLYSISLSKEDTSITNSIRTELYPIYSKDKRSDQAIEYLKIPDLPLSKNACEHSVTIEIYPNPVVDYLTIKIRGYYQGIISIRITDISGHVHYVNKEVVPEVKIDLSCLSSGLYFLEIENLNFVSVNKIIRK